MRSLLVSSSAFLKSWLIRWVARTSNLVAVSVVMSEVFVVVAEVTRKEEEEEEEQMSDENVGVEVGCLSEREVGVK